MENRPIDITSCPPFIPSSPTPDSWAHPMGPPRPFAPSTIPWRRGLLRAALLFGLLPLSNPGTAAAAPMPSGRWIWDTGAAALEFHPCGAALCGRVIWLRDEARSGAEPVLDAHNPEPGLRGRRVCGIDYITGVKQNPEGAWVGGRIYDFVQGGHYDLDVTDIQPDHIDLRGYKGIRLLGATLHLRPAPADLHACASNPPVQEGVK